MFKRLASGAAVAATLLLTVPLAAQQPPQDDPSPGAAQSRDQDAPPNTDAAAPAVPEGGSPAAEARPPAPEAAESTAEAQVQQPPADPLAMQILASSVSPASNKSAHKDDLGGLSTFYAARSGQPVWIDQNGLNARAKEAAAEIQDAGAWGLDASAFSLPRPADNSPAELAGAEIKFSLAVLKYARFARGGRIDFSAATDIFDVKPPILDPKAVLLAIAQASSPAAYLRGLHPKHEQFRRLRQALAALDEKRSAPVAAKIPAGPGIRPGENHPHVALVRQRLGVPSGEAGEDVYDAPLVSAVRAYQRGEGREPTGVIDGRLRAALNGAAAGSSSGERDRIIVNMERWRLLPDDMGDFYVWNNIPEQVTRVFGDGKMVLMERIVVGKPNTPTPVFSAHMQYIVFQPEWNVPDSIKVNEIAPKLRRASGSSYSYGGFADDFFGFSYGGARDYGGGSQDVLDRMGLRVTLGGQEVDPGSIDWSSTDIRRFQFVQPAGERNVLGVVKFRFPNKHDVYMHDTPDRHLFKESRRAYSHGCMRTQNPVRLAEAVLGRDAGWKPEYVRELAARSGPSNEIKLKTSIPVHVTYFTMEADPDGRVRSYPDLYSHDAKMIAALKGTPLRSASKSSAEALDDTGSRERSRRAYRGSRDYADPWYDD